jgi:membrane associated rhomboid family serine protease
MLDDRDYMRRRPQFELQWSMTVLIVALNVVVYIIQNVLEFGSQFPFNHYFALSVDGLRHGHIWQLLSFQFLHAPLNQGSGIFHLLGNCFTIYVFGQAVEEAIGRFSFLKLYLLGGVLGGLLQMAAGRLWPEHFGQSVIGASAGAFGLLAAFCALFPQRPLNLFFVPIEFRASTLLWISIGVTIVGIFIRNTLVAHCAHLGGILTGLIYVRLITHSQKPLVMWRPFPRKDRRPELVTTRSRDPQFWRRPPAENKIEDLPPAEFITKEVDPILDKISAHGIQSLTERERQILQAARNKMSKK